MRKEEVFEIKTSEFEGPFDLLLLFIEREELDIHSISLSKITNDFLAYILRMQELNIEVASEFIFVAATLMRIKVRTLIPKPVLEEEESEIDLQEDLIQKLILYKQFKLICEDLKVFEEKRQQHFKRGNVEIDFALASKEQVQVEELASFDLYKLMRSYEKVMLVYENRGEAEPHLVVQYPYTIEEQKRTIAALLELNKKVDFFKIASNSENRVQFVYSFLAILEMLQQQVVELQLGLGYNNFSISGKSG